MTPEGLNGKPSPRRGEVESRSDRVREQDLSGEDSAPSPCPLPGGERVSLRAVAAGRKDSAANPTATQRARHLRSNQTDPERLLWSRLRAHRLCGWKFRRQMPIGRFIVDFCCPDARLVVELDGGGHSRDDAVTRDAIRTRDIEAVGYLLIRFWNREVVENLEGVCETILAQIEKRK